MATERNAPRDGSQPEAAVSENTAVPGVFYFGPPRGPEATTIMPRPLLTTAPEEEAERASEPAHGPFARIAGRLARWLAQRLEMVARRLGDGRD